MGSDSISPLPPPPPPPKKKKKQNKTKTKQNKKQNKTKKKKNSFGREYRARSSLCTHAFHPTDSRDPDIHTLDGCMPATKTHPACTIYEDEM